MDLNQLARNIDELKAYMSKLRKDEKTLIMREKALASEFQIPSGNPQKLKNKMVHGLPSHSESSPLLDSARAKRPEKILIFWSRQIIRRRHAKS